MQIPITTNGNSAAFALEDRGYYIGCQGTWGGATVKFEIDLGLGFMPILGENNQQLTFTSDQFARMYGNVKVRVVVTGATGTTNLIFFAF